MENDSRSGKILVAIMFDIGPPNPFSLAHSSPARLYSLDVLLAHSIGEAMESRIQEFDGTKTAIMVVGYKELAKDIDLSKYLGRLSKRYYGTYNNSTTTNDTGRITFVGGPQFRRNAEKLMKKEKFIRY